MKFIDKTNYVELDSIITSNTSSEFQTMYKIFINPWNTKQGSFAINCIYIPKDPHFLEGKTKKDKFEKLYEDVISMLNKHEIKDVRLVKTYFPNEDNPYSLEITVENEEEAK